MLVWNALSPTGTPSAADATQFVNAALGGTGLITNIVTAQADFEKEFRSGKFNVYVVLSDGSWFTSQIVKEMTEALNLGDGLIVVYTGQGGLTGSGDLLGVNFQGKFSETGPYTITLTSDGFVPQQQITAVGTALHANATTSLPVGFITSINGSTNGPEGQA